MLALGDHIRYYGRACTISAVGWLGERYYWLTFANGDVAMIPAVVLEPEKSRNDEPRPPTDEAGAGA